MIQGASELIAGGVIPGGTKNNLLHVIDDLFINEGVSDNMQLLLADAQTSGGLLIITDPEQSKTIMERFQSEGLFAKVIGEIIPLEEKLLNLKSIY